MSEQDPETAKMHERLVELETKTAFQEQTIQELNEAIVRQQNDLALLSEQIRQLSERVKAIAPSPLAPDSEETPPPHY
jgi:SlyX protein